MITGTLYQPAAIIGIVSDGSALATAQTLAATAQTLAALTLTMFNRMYLGVF